MSKSIFQKSIVATLGLAIVSTGLFASISSHAQGGTPTPVGSPKPNLPASDIKPAGGGTMGKPATTTPGGAMGKPDATTPSDGMSKPNKMPETTTAPAGKTIVDIAARSKSFTILVAAVKAADLVETLSGEGPYTVFAPTDDAFKKLGKAKLKELLKPENKEQLKKILTYHVVSGAVTSKTLKAGKVETVEGGSITVKLKGKKVMINNATVLKADVKASNGIIHAIDTVLLPAK